MSELDQLLEGVAGFLHGSEPEFLRSLASEVSPPNCIVEIGSFRGRSTIALAYGAPDGVIVYAVDPHEEHEVLGLKFGMADNAAFFENVSRARMGSRVRVLNISSQAANRMWHDEIFVTKPAPGLVWIDGSHEYDDVKYDVWHWGGHHLAVGGKLAIHDSNGTWADPTRVADELAANANWKELPGCAYTRVFQKVSA